MPKINVKAESNDEFGFDLRQYPHLSVESNDMLLSHEARIEVVVKFEHHDVDTARGLVRFRNWLAARELVRRTG